MALTDIKIRNAKPTDKPFSMADESGLSILIQPSGGQWWRFRYRFDGKPKMISLGTYPEIGLKDARDKRDEVRKQVANGIDPSENRKARKAAKVERATNSFEIVAREWFANKKPTWAPVMQTRSSSGWKTTFFLGLEIAPSLKSRPPKY